MINSKSKIPSHAKSFPEKKDLFLALECFVNWWCYQVTKTLKERAHALSTTIGEFILLLHTPYIARIKEWNQKSRISSYSYTQQQHHVNTSCGVLSVFWTRKVGFCEGHVCTWITRVIITARNNCNKPKRGFVVKRVCLPYDHTRLHRSDGGRVVHIKLPPRKKPYYSVPPSFKIRIEPIRAKHKKKTLSLSTSLSSPLSVCLSIYFLLPPFWATPDDTQVQKPAVWSWKPKKPQQQL